MDTIATQYLICFCLTSVCEFFIEGFAQPTKNDILLLEIDIFEPPTIGNICSKLCMYWTYTYTLCTYQVHRINSTLRTSSLAIYVIFAPVCIYQIM